MLKKKSICSVAALRYVLSQLLSADKILILGLLQQLYQQVNNKLLFVRRVQAFPDRHLLSEPSS